MTPETVHAAPLGPQVRYARLSLSWFALNVSALADTATEPQWRWGRSLSWRNNFACIRDGDAKPLGDRRVSPPWAGGRTGEALWSQYAWGSSNHRTSVRSAWVNVFPIRLTPPARLLDGGPWSGVIHELVYPHGVGCVADLTFRSATPLPFDDFCDATATFRQADHVFAGADVPVGDLADIADRRLTGLSEAAFGGPPDGGAPGWSVCTIINGVRGADPPVTWLRRASSALVYGLRDWRTAPPEAVTGPVYPVVNATAAQMFSGSAGRWTYSPALLAGGKGLADFHRAMMWMSQQVDALGVFAQYLAADDKGELPPSAYGLRRPVGMALGRLRGGAGPVPAATVIRQLDDRGFSRHLAAIRRAEQLD